MQRHPFVKLGALSAALLALASTPVIAIGLGASTARSVEKDTAAIESATGTASAPAASAPRTGSATSDVSDHRPHAKYRSVRGR